MENSNKSGLVQALKAPVFEIPSSSAMDGVDMARRIVTILP